MNRLGFHSRAFTLIELLVVISVIALLSSTVLASLNSARAKGALAAARSADTNLYHAAGDMLVGDWEFNECLGTSSSDISSISGLSAGVSGSITWSPDTQSGTGCSASLPGTQSISLGSSANLPDVSAVKTISVWAKYNSVSGTQSNLVLLGSVGTYAIQFGFKTTGAPWVWKWGGATLAQGQIAPSAGVWHNYIYTYDGTTNRLYVDGSEVGNSTTAPQSGVGNLYIGGYSAEYFSGLIDSVRIYSKAFSANDALNLYASESRHFMSLAEK